MDYENIIEEMKQKVAERYKNFTIYDNSWNYILMFLKSYKIDMSNYEIGNFNDSLDNVYDIEIKCKTKFNDIDTDVSFIFDKYGTIKIRMMTNINKLEG